VQQVIDTTTMWPAAARPAQRICSRAVCWCRAGAVWQHVTCCLDAQSQPRVCGLSLSAQGLSGPLPALGRLIFAQLAMDQAAVLSEGAEGSSSDVTGQSAAVMQ
jgi:hypothetical protein